jgi:hypothetical protein
MSNQDWNYQSGYMKRMVLGNTLEANKDIFQHKKHTLSIGPQRNAFAAPTIKARANSP